MRVSKISSHVSTMLAMAVLAGPAQAAWDAAPSITIETGHTSNLPLSPNRPDSTMQNTVEGNLSGRYYTDVTTIRARVSAGYTTYPGANETVSDTDRQSAALLFNHRAERMAFGGSIGYKKDDLLRRSFTVPEDASPFDDDSIGVDPVDEISPDPTNEPDSVDDAFDSELNPSDSQLTRKNYRASAFTQLRIDERNRLRLTYRYNERDLSGGSTFDNSTATQEPIRNTTRNALALQWAHDLSERSTLLTNVEASKVKTDGREEVDYYTGDLAWRSKLSPTWQLEAAAGITVLDGIDGTDVGWLAGLLSRTKLAKGELVMELRRDLQPSIFGGVEERDRIRAEFSRTLAPKLSTSISARGIRSRRSRRSSDIDQDHFSVSQSLRWRFHPAIEAIASYEYRWIDRTGQSQSFVEGSAKAHIGALSVRYSPAGIGSRQ